MLYGHFFAHRIPGLSGVDRRVLGMSYLPLVCRLATLWKKSCMVLQDLSWIKGLAVLRSKPLKISWRDAFAGLLQPM